MSRNPSQESIDDLKALETDGHRLTGRDGAHIRNRHDRYDFVHLQQVKDAILARTPAYEKLQVLMLSWKNAKGDSLDDVARLKDFLGSNLRCTVITHIIECTAHGEVCSDHKRQLRDVMSSILSPADDQTLSVVYYSGTGFKGISTSLNPPEEEMEMLHRNFKT